MNVNILFGKYFILSALGFVITMVGISPAFATEPCDDFGECKVLIEINSSDGDIGFHWKGDASNLQSMHIFDPMKRKVFGNRAFGPLRKQTITETFGESSEPLCWPDPEADEEDLEEIVTLRDFRSIWKPGTYKFIGITSKHGYKSYKKGFLRGKTELTYDLPAAPQNLEFSGGVISWTGGNDLGNCAPLSGGVGQETIPEVLDIITDPALVPVAAFEVVLEPDVEDGDPTGSLVYSIRVSGDTFAVEVPALYLASLPEDTPVKIEVGAIGVDDNATFTEEDGFCVNESEGCED